MTLAVDASQIFDPDYRTLFREPSPLSANYRTYLRTWLFGEPNPLDAYNERWHSAAPLDANNFRSFRDKIFSILCEHYMSARALQQGIPLYDVVTGRYHGCDECA